MYIINNNMAGILMKYHVEYTESCNGSFTMRLVKRKPAICICDNEGVDQLQLGLTAQLISTIVFSTKIEQIYFLSKIQNFKPLDIFCGRTAPFVSDLVGNPEDRISHVAHICIN